MVGDPDAPARRAGLDPDDRLDPAFVHELEGNPAQRYQLGRPQELPPDLHGLPEELLPGADQQHRCCWSFSSSARPRSASVLAYLLDKDIRGTRILPGQSFSPRSCSPWRSSASCGRASSTRPTNGLATQLFGHGKEVDWLGNQSLPDSDSARLRRLQELRRDPGRDRLAAHRLHHGALPGRAEERRSTRCGKQPCWMAATNGRPSGTSSSRR